MDKLMGYRIGAPVRFLPIGGKMSLHGFILRLEDFGMPVIKSAQGKLFRGYECWWTYKFKRDARSLNAKTR